MRWMKPAVSGILILVAVVLAWSNSVGAPFGFDDLPSIVDNRTIRDVWSLDWMVPPAAAGETVSGRPVLNFTFAVNHALGGLDVRGYHVVNTIIHALAALTLFGVVRRTLGSLRGRSPLAGGSEPSPASGLLPDDANLVALSVALLWALHPLHTGAVTYIVQRAESLCGLFYLLTLYCFVRGIEDNALKQESRARLWFTAAVASCLLAVGTKEVAATAPVVVLLFDRAFVAGSFREALRARWKIYTALAASWIPLAVLVFANRGRGGSAGLGAEIDSWSYLLTQSDAVIRYLALAIWPVGQVFDYGTQRVESLAEVWWQAGAILILLFVTLWAIMRKPRGGFLLASFFVLLAPSSSFVPVATQTIAEHRMYLPLAALVVIVCAAVRTMVRRLEAVHDPAASGPPREGRDGSEVPPPTQRAAAVATAVSVVVIVALGAATFARNRVYRSELALWQDTVAKRPDNPRAHNNLGMALSSAGRTEEAIAEFQAAIALHPNHAFAHFNLAVLRTKQEMWDDAVAHYNAAIAADPDHVSARVNLGGVLARLERTGEAIAQHQAALAIDPDAHDARTNLAALLIRVDRAAEAVPMLRSVVAAAPELAEAHFQLGLALEKTGGSATEVDAAFLAALGLKPEFAAAHLAVGNRLAKRGDVSGAERSFREAIRLDARLAGAHFALGNILAGRKQFDAAITAYREALAIEPAHAHALNNLGNCQLVLGRVREAAATYERVLRLRPGDEAVMKHLELARELERTGAPRGN